MKKPKNFLCYSDFLPKNVEMSATIQSIDWSRNPLGAPLDWPKELKHAVAILLASGYPAFICWGKSFHTFFNDTFYSLYGGLVGRHSVGDIAEKAFECCWDRIGVAVDTVYQGTEGALLEIEVPVRDSVSHTYIEIQFSKIIGLDGETIGVAGSCRDVTKKTLAMNALGLNNNELKAANQQLREGQLRLDETLSRVTKKYKESQQIMEVLSRMASEEVDLKLVMQDMVDVATKVTGAKYGIFFYNDRDENGNSALLYTFSGTNQEAFECFEVFKNAVFPNSKFAEEGIVRRGNITESQSYKKAKPEKSATDTFIVTSYLSAPVTSRSGKVLGRMFFGHPETARFTAEHEEIIVAVAAQVAANIDNVQLFEEVRELNTKKDEFIELASHELRTPLASVNGYLQILKRQMAEEANQKYLDKAIQQTNKLTYLVSDLIEVLQLEAGKLELNIAEFELGQLINEAIDFVRSTASSHAINFYHDNEPCLALADGLRIGNVIIHLLANAIKYSPRADLVEVALHREENMAVVSIRDYGIGIPAGKIKYVFSRFARLDSATPNISGLGIGLYLARELVVRHGGTIWAESEEGKGSTFWFEVPLSKG